MARQGYVFLSIVGAVSVFVIILLLVVAIQPFSARRIDLNALDVVYLSWPDDKHINRGYGGQLVTEEVSTWCEFGIVLKAGETLTVIVILQHDTGKSFEEASAGLLLTGWMRPFAERPDLVYAINPKNTELTTLSSSSQETFPHASGSYIMNTDPPTPFLRREQGQSASNEALTFIRELLVGGAHIEATVGQSAGGSVLYQVSAQMEFGVEQHDSAMACLKQTGAIQNIRE